MAINDNDHRPIIGVDLDGVLNLFDGWKGSEYFHPPRPGAAEFLHQLNEAGYRVVISTVRYHRWVQAWLDEHGLAEFVDMVTNRKLPAHVYLDDRAICFRGDFDEALKEILSFKAHWEDSLTAHDQASLSSDSRRDR